MDYPCGKRLAPGMDWLITKLEACGEIKIEGGVREKLLSLSASTIDRLLKEEKKKIALKPNFPKNYNYVFGSIPRLSII